MVNATYRRDKTSHSFSVVGHAGYSECGNDIVCAGVSAVIYSLLGFLNNIPDKDKHLTAVAESGNTHIFWRETCTEVSAAFQMALIGLMQIALKYPEHITVDYKAETDELNPMK